jgi:hypothetical protein
MRAAGDEASIQTDCQDPVTSIAYKVCLIVECRRESRFQGESTPEPGLSQSRLTGNSGDGAQPVLSFDSGGIKRQRMREQAGEELELFGGSKTGGIMDIEAGMRGQRHRSPQLHPCPARFASMDRQGEKVMQIGVMRILIEEAQVDGCRHIQLTGAVGGEGCLQRHSSGL